MLNYNDVVSPTFIICFNHEKFLTLPSLVLNMAGFNLSCLNIPLKNVMSGVVSKLGNIFGFLLKTNSYGLQFAKFGY